MASDVPDLDLSSLLQRDDHESPAAAVDCLPDLASLLDSAPATVAAAPAVQLPDLTEIIALAPDPTQQDIIAVAPDPKQQKKPKRKFGFDHYVNGKRVRTVRADGVAKSRTECLAIAREAN